MPKYTSENKVERKPARSTASGSSIKVKKATKNITLLHEIPEFDNTFGENLENLERDTMDESWFEALTVQFKQPYFIKLKKFLVSEAKSAVVYPPLKDIYSWSRLTPLQSVKVVILGQDPYHNVGQAHGLSFSVLPPTPPPPSLKNIYKQLAEDIPSFVIPTSGDLRPLAKEGVLWLNTSLSVRAHEAASHSKKGWEQLTEAAIRAVLDQQASTDGSSGVVFMAWGAHAQKVCAKIGVDETVNLVLKSNHPSPLSAYRGFLGNGHFRLANKWLADRHGEDSQVDWTVICGEKTKL